MHIDRVQYNSAFGLTDPYAAQRAEAKQRAEETRKKLGEFASLFEGEADESLVELSEREDGESEPQERYRGQDEKTQSDRESDTAEPQISDWA